MSTAYQVAMELLVNRVGLQRDTADRICCEIGVTTLDDLVVDLQRDEATEDSVNAELAKIAKTLPCDECGGDKETGHQNLCPVNLRLAGIGQSKDAINAELLSACVGAKRRLEIESRNWDVGGQKIMASDEYKAIVTALANVKVGDDQRTPSITRQMAVMKTALERIDKTNGSTGGSDALVREFKTTASMALGLVADLQAGRMV